MAVNNLFIVKYNISNLNCILYQDNILKFHRFISLIIDNVKSLTHYAYLD